MKRTVRFLALALVFVMMVGVLASCGRISGVYKSEDGKATFTFDGGDFSYSTGTITMKGSYKIMGEEKEQRMQLLVEVQIVDKKVTTLEDPYYIGDEDGVKFVEGDGYIVLDTTKYLLQEFE